MADVWAIQWHIIPEPPATVQGAATWRIQCHDSRATCHIAGCCHRANSMACHDVIPVPCITVQGAATWWIHCNDSRATCHIAGCSHLVKSTSWSCYITGCKNSIRHIEICLSPYFIFLFLMQFRLWRAAAFVSSPIHLLHQLHMVCYKVGELRNRYDAKLVHFKHFFLVYFCKKMSKLGLRTKKVLWKWNPYQLFNMWTFDNSFSSR